MNDTVLNIANYLLIILGISSLFIAMVILIDSRANKKPESKKESVSVDILRLVIQSDSFDNVNKMLDTIIKDAIEMYTILNGVDQETYITNEMTNEMYDYVYGMTYKKMTPAVRSAIGLFYNVDKESDLIDLLKLRIKLHLINEIYQQNLPIE